jgi:hypothetical protein
MTQPGLSDTVHILTMGVLTPLLTFLAMGFGAAALGNRFRRFSILTFVALVVGSVLTGVETARVAAGVPVPWFGLAERTHFGAWLLWVAGLAVALVRVPLERPRDDRGRPLTDR